MTDLTGAIWRKSGRSGSSGGNCVEVAGNLTTVVGIRDSKDPAGPALVVSRSAFRTFTASLKTR
ncbi:DUF397 domain-containing protein [Catenuloplanes japonicus]|uniref:DUF397 domain-containing protein n=1 Tax=Catenuloplanes japonicus TaxID=33876 RepID=UPI0005275056|nr:DUF397 domain-containing protein [Catenuloplanes japonicus]